ncbi:MAG TPA: hypothetical protein DCG69_00730 [Bacteroidales bacterium]|nr:hypothetical protein [Bacteroidales bacterium]
MIKHEKAQLSNFLIEKKISAQQNNFFYVLKLLYKKQGKFAFIYIKKCIFTYHLLKTRKFIELLIK